MTDGSEPVHPACMPPLSCGEPPSIEEVEDRISALEEATAEVATDLAELREEKRQLPSIDRIRDELDQIAADLGSAGAQAQGVSLDG